MSTTLGSLEVGSIVMLREVGVFAEFYVATHNYEPLLNGSGRTLLVRKGGAADEISDGVLWNQSNDDGNAYAISYVDSWFNGDYKKKLDNGIEELLGTTRFYYTPGCGISDVSTISRSVFMLSVTELGLESTGANAEGTALPIAETLRGAVISQWTRSPHATDKRHVYYVKDGEAEISVPNGGFGIVPAFTLPEETEVNDDGTIVRNPVLADVAVGNTVKIDEAGILTEFYVAKHNYESELNGVGRTLLVRKKEITPGGVWDAENLNAYNGCDADTWFNQEYIANFNPAIVEAMGKTTFWYTLGNSDKTVSVLARPIFALSLTELGLTAGTAYSNIEGTALPIAEILAATDNTQWTRTPGLHADNVVFGVTSSGKVHWASAANYAYRRPAFTLPEDISVDEDGVVIFAVSPEVKSTVENGTDLGTTDEWIDLQYFVASGEPDDVITVKEYLDGVLMRTYTTDPVTYQQIECVNAANYYKVSNGKHTITVETSNGNESSTYSVTFTKKVTHATISLDMPMEADDQITIMVATIVGEIPADAEVEFLVTNNGNDPEPVWEDATDAVLNGESYVFTNQTAEAGYAFNFKLTVNRGTNDVGGYISGIGGAFQ